MCEYSKPFRHGTLLTTQHTDIATLVHTVRRDVPRSQIALTIPLQFGFVVQNSKNHAWASRIQSTNQYWTGFVALVPQTALMVLSIRPVRSRGFEIFKK